MEWEKGDSPEGKLARSFPKKGSQMDRHKGLQDMTSSQEGHKPPSALSPCNNRFLLFNAQDLPSASHGFSLIITTVFQLGVRIPYFTDKEPRAQRGQVSCPKAHI